MPGGAGICEFVGAVGVPCPHGSKLPGKVSLLGCSRTGLAATPPVAGDGAAGVIGLNIELGLGMKPEAHGKGV